MKQLQVALAAACFLMALGAALELHLVQVTPTDDVLAVATRLEEVRQLERLQEIADSAPESPLAKAMTAGLSARAKKTDPAAAMKQSQDGHRLGRLAPTLLAALLVLGSIIVIVAGRRTLSRVAVVLMLVGLLLTGSAVLTSTRVESQLEHAVQTLGPMFSVQSPGDAG